MFSAAPAKLADCKVLNETKGQDSALVSGMIVKKLASQLCLCEGTSRCVTFFHIQCLLSCLTSRTKPPKAAIASLALTVSMLRSKL